ncbi:MAG: hypothetical protein PHN42_00305 [Bacilli bacterium]|nr:hypothetical protein [Bacilli bacterium]
MKRINNITKDELNKLYNLSKLNPMIKEDYEFEKWLLEFEKNIAIGKNLNGAIFDKHYILDDNVLILKESECLSINPLPFENDKQKMSDISKKTSLLIMNNKIGTIIIKDMIIDNNFIFDNLSAYKVKFVNCYFIDNFVFNFNFVQTLEFLYCSLPNFNIFSNINVSELIISRSKFRQDSTKFNKINAKDIIIKSTNLNYKHLFYISSFEYLENLEISNKVFNDSDIIMLDQIAPVLKKARLNIVLKDLNTFEKINPMVYFTYPFKYDEVETFNTDYEFVSNSEIRYKLTDLDERTKIIENIELSIDSVYKNKAYKNLKSREIFHEEIDNNIEKYKLDNNKDRLLELIILSLNSLEENIIKDNIDEDTKRLLLLEIKNFENNTKRLERCLMFNSFSSQLHIELDFIFKHLYNNLSDMNFFAQKENYRSVNKDGSVINPLYIDKSIERMEKVLNDFKNKKKTTFDFFDILSITELNLSFMYIFKRKRNFNFYKNITLNKKELEFITPAIKNELISGDKLLETFNINKNVKNLGIILPYCENNVFKDYMEIINLDASFEKSKLFELKQVMKYLTTKQIPKTKHEIMVSSCSLDKYRDVNENLKKYKNRTTRLSKFMEIYGNDDEYNIEDYKLYLKNYRCLNENIIYTKICLSIMYENKEKLFKLTAEDYENIKKTINDKYSYRQYNMELFYYYELINYITKNYPDFLNRYIKTYSILENEKKHVFILEHYHETRKEEMKKLVIEEFNKSRTDIEEKQKMLIKM